MAKIFVFFWCLAGLLTLDVVLRAAPRPQRPTLAAASAGYPDSMPVVDLIRSRCELPAGTLVFVVRGRETSP